MARSLLIILAGGSSVVHGLAFDAPQATQAVQDWGRGWTPAPTSTPNSPAELVKRNLLEGRQFASTILVAQDQTCGYLNGSPGAAYTCGAVTSTCNLFPPTGTLSWGAIACCANGQCNGNLFCINSADYYASKCDDDCHFDTFTLKCTGSAAPYCNTAVWPGVKVRDVYCAARSVSTTQTMYTTYSGQEIGGRFTPQTLDGDVITTTSKSTTRSTTRTSSSSSSSTSSSSTIPQGPQTTVPGDPRISPVPVPIEEKSTPVGAIVGGVVGGLAVLALIGFGIWFIRRRNRKDKAVAVDSHGSQPPPVYHPSQPEIDSTAVVGKPAMTETQYPYTGAFAPAISSKGQEYQNQPQQQFDQPHHNTGAASPNGTAVGTYDPNRESTLSPISPHSQSGSVGGSPQMSTRESYVSSAFSPPPPPAASVQQVHEMPINNAYEMSASSPIERKPVGINKAGVSNAT